MRLEYQIAQKLHGVSAPGSKRAHDLIDLQLIVARAAIDYSLTHDICKRLFNYRKVHEWPPTINKGENWEETYRHQMEGLPVLPTIDAAITWANTLISTICAHDQ